MAYVPVPKDLTKIKTKVVLNLTKRQLICFALAAAVGIPAYLLTRGAAGSSAAVLLMIGLMLPFFFMAMYEKDGQPAEKILRNYIRVKLWPGTRPYKTENLYKYLNEEGNVTLHPIAPAGARRRRDNIGIKGKAAGAAPAKKRRAGKEK